MAKKETAPGGRSTSKKSKKATDSRKVATSNQAGRTKTAKSPSPKPGASGKGQKRATKADAPTKQRKATAKRQARARPAIVRRQALSQRVRESVTRAIRVLTDRNTWKRVAASLPPWTDEVVALLLLVSGVVMLNALLNTTSEASLAVGLSTFLRQLFGQAAYLVALGVMMVGAIILLPKFGRTVHIGWTRGLAIEIAFASLMAILHLLADDPEPYALAREGGGGGLIGWALMTLLSGFGYSFALVVYSTMLVVGLVLVVQLRVSHVLLAIQWVQGQLRQRLEELDDEVGNPAFDEHPELSDTTEFSDHTGDPPTSTAPKRRRHRGVQRGAGNETAIVPPHVESKAAPPAKGSQASRKGRSAKSQQDANAGASSGTNLQTTKKRGRRASAPQADPEAGTTAIAEDNKPRRPLTKAERKEIALRTRKKLGAENGRSLVAPGEPGERPSVVPREYLPAARPVPAVPRARQRRKSTDSAWDRVFTVEDFREARKVGKRDEELPPLDLLSDLELYAPTEEEINTNAQIIKNTLLEFDVETDVIDVKVGPTVTQYAVSPFTEKIDENGDRVIHRVRVSEITNLSGDLALALSAKRLRIQAPVPGHSYVGVEVPNRKPSLVALRPVLESEAFYKYRNRPLALPLGRDTSGASFVTDLATMPHLLIAGTTGSGKSIMLAAMTTALIMNNRPEKVRLVLLDPKMVELSRFNGVPHLLGPVETELDRIIGVLRWATREMDRRYKLLEKEAARNIDTYNAGLGRRRKDEHLPYIVIIIDEIGDLMLQRPDETERTITRLAQMARAVGIHLMVATQRPSVDVITGLIKANFPARISFAVASGVDSRVILDASGAETLMGRGDMLFLAPDASGPQRIQGCYVSDDEVNAVVAYWRQWHEAKVDEGTMEPVTVGPWERGMTRREVLAETDPMLEDAIELVVEEGEASASMIQRRLGLGYPRAARIIDLLHELGIVGGPRPGGRSREVLVKPGTDPFKRLVDRRLDRKK